MSAEAIIGGLGLLSSLFGGDSSARESNALKRRQLDLQERGLANYEQGAKQAQGYRDQGSPYLAKQGSVYDTIGGYGTNDRDFGINLLEQVLGQFTHNAGVSGVNTQYNTATTPGVGGNRTTSRLPGEAASASSLLNRNQPGFSTGSSTGATGTPPAQPQYGDPYALSLPQQEQLNQRVDSINTQSESAIQEYRASLQQQGLPPNPAGEARIRESLGSLVNQERTGAANAAQQERQQALQSLINLALGEKAGGTQLVGQQAQGYGNVASGYNQYAGSALSQAESGPFAQFAGMNQQGAQFAQQNSTNEFDVLGQLIPFIMQAMQGGAKKKPTQAATGGSSYYNPDMNAGNANLFPDYYGR